MGTNQESIGKDQESSRKETRIRRMEELSKSEANSAVAYLVRLAREKSGVSQFHHWAATGISKATTRWIAAGQMSPTIVTLEKILAGYGYRLKIDIVPLD